MSLRNLECYIYELVQCFEGFVKATLLLLLLGLTAVIAMLYSIMNKLAIADQQRRAASTVALAQLASSYADGEETTVESEEDAKQKRIKKGKKKNKKSTKLDDADQNVEDTKKSDDEENNEPNAGKAEDGSICDRPCAKYPVTSTHAGPDVIPCGLTNPPCEGVVVCDPKRMKRQKICRDGRITKRPSSPRASLICTPSNCSLNSKNCLSHLPGCTSNGQLYTCRRLTRKLSCCSDCCEH